jgi:FMN phosphatase YigB (HAD superfamily)
LSLDISNIIHMLNTVLFDLDNTLILFDEAAFFRRYMELVQAELSDLIPPDELGKKLLSATQALMENQGRMSNLDFFMHMFSPESEKRAGRIFDRFERFYASGYDQLKSLTIPIEGVRDIVKGISGRGLDLVIASNPLLPQSIQEKRLAWAGLEDVSFTLITHLANMSYVKPQAGYYREICAKIRRRPEECLMVGNDPVNDMAAAIIGIRTYLTTDSRDVDRSRLAMSRGLLEEKDMVTCPPDYEGPLAGVFAAVDSLLGP